MRQMLCPDSACNGVMRAWGVGVSSPDLSLVHVEWLPFAVVIAGGRRLSSHIRRPAIYPPSDGYQPPEDPLVGVGRQIDATRQVKEACPGAIVVGSGYSYLQEYLPHVAQAVVRNGWTDFVGYGRLVLSYPEFADDVLRKGKLERKRICRTFSDCTTAPRNGLISGCYPLDDHYSGRPEFLTLREIKTGAGR